MPEKNKIGMNTKKTKPAIPAMCEQKRLIIPPEIEH